MSPEYLVCRLLSDGKVAYTTAVPVRSYDFAEEHARYLANEYPGRVYAVLQVVATTATRTQIVVEKVS